MLKHRIRMEVLLWLAVIMVIAYIDRVNFSMAAPIVMKEFGMTAAQLGMVFSAFTLGYTLLNFPGGFIVERFSARVTIVAIIFFWSIMTGLTALTWSFISLLIVRVAFGAFEGPMIPAITKLVNAWVTPKERGMASGLWMAALPMGVIIGNPLSGLIIDAWGWHSVFFMYGAFGILITYISWRLIRNRPQEHPRISTEEIDIINTSIHRHEGACRLTATGSTVMQLLSNPWLWVMSIIYFCAAIVFWANLNWLPTYFIKARGSSLLKSGFISVIPWIAGALGAFFYGWLSDHFGKIRAVWLAIGFFVMSPFIGYAVITPSLNVCLVCFVIAVFLNMGCLGLMYAIPMEIFAPADVAKASGIMLGWGSFSGIISPTLVGFIVDSTNSFNAAYYIFAVVSVLGGLLSLPLIVKEKARLKEKIYSSVIPLQKTEAD